MSTTNPDTPANSVIHSVPDGQPSTPPSAPPSTPPSPPPATPIPSACAPKPWWKSKTLGLVALAIIAAVIQVIQGQEWVRADIQVGVLAVLSALIRIFGTEAPIKGTPAANRLLGISKKK